MYKRQILKKAGIEGCDILVAVTNDDNVNLMVSQVGKEIFGVPKVLTRIYDPRRRDVFSQFGLHTICPTSITTNTILWEIEEDAEDGIQVTIGDNTLGLITWAIPSQFVGQTVSKLPLKKGYAILGLVDAKGTVTYLGGKTNDAMVFPGDRLLCGRVLD